MTDENYCNRRTLDKSGKHSTTLGLQEKLIKDGYKVAASEFHRYDTPTGELIRKWLYGSYNVNQEAIELIMAADKYAQKDFIESLEQEGYDYLILDRYIGSDIAYSYSSGINLHWKENILAGLREPDFEIFIDVSPETSMSRKGKHGDNDRYESDLELLSTARQSFMELRNNDYDKYCPTEFFVVNGENSIEETIESAYSFIKAKTT